MKKPPGYGKPVSVIFDKNDTKKQTEKFLSERFKIFFPEHNQCTIIGSTSLYMTKEKKSLYLHKDLNKARAGAHLVCDGFRANLPIFSEDFQSMTVKTAIADGLGYEENDALFNKSIAMTSAEFTKAWANSNLPATLEAKKTIAVLKKLATQVNTNLPENLKTHSPTCSFASGILEYKQGKWLSRFTNIGDSMIVIINAKTLSVKYILPAIVKHRSRGNYSPNSVQELTTIWGDSVSIQDVMLELQEDDVIVYMTDGVYAEFPLTSTPSEETEKSWDKDHPVCLQTTITKEAIENTLAPLKSKKTTSAFDIATALLEKQTTQYLNNFNDARQILKTIQTEVKKDPKISFLTIDDYLKKAKIKDLAFFSMLDSFLSDSGRHDGVAFNIHIAQISHLQSTLETQEYGDCATISVIKVPSYHQELIKALVKTQNDSVLNVISSVMEFEQARKIITDLSLTDCCPMPLETNGVTFSEIKMTRAFTASELKKALMKIESHYEALSSPLSSKIEELSTSLANTSIHDTSKPPSERTDGAGAFRLSKQKSLRDGTRIQDPSKKRKTNTKHRKK